MAISSQLPVVLHAKAGSVLRAMALTPGQNVEARVVQQSSDGTTRVQIGGQFLSLNVSGTQPVGTLLTLAVQQVDGQMRLALLSTRPPSASALSQPATSIQLSLAQGSPQPPAVQAYGPPTPLAAGASAPLQAGVSGAPSSQSASVSGGQTDKPVASGMGQAGAPAMARISSAAYGVAPAATNGQGPVQAALSQMVQQAISQQVSLAGVSSLLTALVSQSGLPEPLLKLGRQILGNQLDLSGKVDGAALKAAVARSGLFQEAALAANRPVAAGGDTKSGLLALRQGLAQWLGGESQLSPIVRIPPPLRGMVPRVRQAEHLPPVLPLDPEDAGRLLLERTDGALSRIRLQQNASLPDPVHRNEMQWTLDLPVVVAGFHTIINLQIHQDAPAETSAPEERSWQVSFATNLPEIGEIGAQVSLRGKLTGILLWAERTSVVADLSSGVDGLREELAAVGLMPGAIVVRVGAPAEPLSVKHTGAALDALL